MARYVVLALLLLLPAAKYTQYTNADSAPPLSALARMPVKEITVFKDGHAFVLHQGTMPTDSSGAVVMDYLPTPVLGTFWPFSADNRARLTAVTASQQRVMVQHTALTIREMIECNPGATALITEMNGTKYSATIVGIPARSSEELQATSPPNSGDPLPEKGSILLLKMTEGVKALPIDRIQDITFVSEPKSKLASEEYRNLLTLKLDWGERPPDRSAEVGLMYLQAGIRWIPSYKVTLVGEDRASIRLEGTLVNDMIDVQDITANLVIGVPNFDFRGMTDPIAIQEVAAEVARAQNGALNMLNNSIATQIARPADGEERGRDNSGRSSGLQPPESSAHEDLFVFTVKHVTMKKGERMVLPIAEFDVPYKDVFALDIPYAPPAEVRFNMNSEQQMDLARRLNQAGVMHRIRLNNTSSYPLTTAPALIVKDGRVLAQGTMNYTAIGASTDLDVTRAVDIQVKKGEVESSRTTNAVRINGDDFTRVNIDGALKITNFKPKPVEIEVVRQVLGTVDSASNDAVVQKVNLVEDGKYMGPGDLPYWWGYYSWPNWWHQMNGIARISWKLKLDPGKEADLSYSWHYFWR
ncbi:MAG TPA: hypothetical protein VJX67_20955 [Blastocatellia bacterium]|nr:hypothetical protein [Blastocatellia bacterium]